MSKHRHKAHHAKMRAHKDHGGKGVAYSGGKSKVASEAMSKDDGFKHGGKVPGHKGKHRMDKRARGGRTGGKSPFSSAHIKTAGHHA